MKEVGVGRETDTQRRAERGCELQPFEETRFASNNFLLSETFDSIEIEDFSMARPLGVMVKNLSPSSFPMKPPLSALL